jgi:hypothetical protein
MRRFYASSMLHRLNVSVNALISKLRICADLMEFGSRMRIYVEQHADHRGMPMLLKLHLDGHQLDVLEALDQWYGPHYRYIKVRGYDGGLYILRFDERHAEWELTMFVSARAQLRMA